MSTTLKHREFIGEPMGEKPVNKIAGIGPASGARLEENKYDKANKVFAQYLMEDRDEIKFADFLKDKGGVRADRAKQAYDCLKEWDHQNF